MRAASFGGTEPVDLPLALAELHLATAPGDVVEIVDIGWPRADGEPPLEDVVTGAGFAAPDGTTRLTLERQRTLPDTVGPRMRLLVCGLNPSVYSADRGVGYARPNNRFWTAAVEAGLVPRPRDPLGALREAGVGMTDVCKRATKASSELAEDEYREGADRVERLVAWLRPGAVCFVGLEGWRAAIDRLAKPGPQPRPFGGRPAYVMPSTSGLNAHSKPAEHVAHLRAALALALAAGTGTGFYPDQHYKYVSPVPSTGRSERATAASSATGRVP